MLFNKLIFVETDSIFFVGDVFIERRSVNTVGDFDFVGKVVLLVMAGVVLTLFFTRFVVLTVLRVSPGLMMSSGCTTNLNLENLGVSFSAALIAGMSTMEEKKKQTQKRRNRDIFDFH